MTLQTQAYRPEAATDAVEQRRREQTWKALNVYVQERSGWITSPPGMRVRLECARGSNLPSQLTKLGFTVKSAGTATRNGGPTGFMPVDVFELQIDGC
jgi:hypothetical protein